MPPVDNRARPPPGVSEAGSASESRPQAVTPVIGLVTCKTGSVPYSGRFDTMATTLSTQVLPHAVDWQGGISDTLAAVMSFIPKLLIFLVVLFVAWIVAKAVSKGLGIILQKSGFTTLLDKAGADETLAKASIDPISLITKLAYYFILLIGLQLALTAFGPSNPVSAIVNDIVAWLPKAVVAIVIVVIAAAVANAVKDILSGVLGGLSYGPMLAKVVAGFIVALGVIAALNQVGIGLSVTLPVLVAVLATIGGILVVGVGGGLIGPMRQRWEGWLGQIEQDTRQVKATRPTTTSSDYATTSSGYATGSSYGTGSTQGSTYGGSGSTQGVAPPPESGTQQF